MGVASLVATGSADADVAQRHQVTTWLDPDGRPVFTRSDAPMAAAAAAEGLRYVGTEVDRAVEAFDVNDPGRLWQWAFDDVPFQQTWPSTTGTGVVVAVLDTGVNQAHPDLAGVVLPGRQILNGVQQPGGTVDAHGHGTHVAGIVAGVPDNGLGVAGMAPGVHILPVKVLDDNGSGVFSDVAAGIVWATDNGADVINLSLGAATGVPDLTVSAAVTYASDHGVVVVAAAGNFGCHVGVDPDCLAVYPAALPDVLAVGAFDSSGNCAAYTASAPYVDLGAPGTSIYSTYRSGYAFMSGTSMASPHVAAAAALVRAVAPTATAAQVRDLLTGHAHDTAVDASCEGTGQVDPLAAVQAASAAPPTPPTPPTPAGPVPPVAPEVRTAAYGPVGPVRLLDTRLDGSVLRAGQSRAVAIRDVPGLEHASAVAVSLTGIDRGGGGYLTAWGGGTARPTASSLNLEAGAVRSNAVIVPVGPDGSISVWAQRDTDLVLDVTGAFVPAASSAAGRLVVTTPTRVLDTRDARSPYAPGETRAVDLTAAGVPSDAVAAVVSITVADSPRGWWAAWRDGQAWGGTSTLNVADKATTTNALVPLANGRFQVRSQLGGQLVVDVNGWFTGPSAVAGTAGLFVPLDPTRLVDTRTTGRIGDGGRVAVGPPAGVASPAAVAVNLTAVDPGASTYLTLFAADAARPLASAANAAPGVITATGAVSPSSDGGFAVYAQRDVALVVDMTGYFQR